jgi:proline iminopeptidase
VKDFTTVFIDTRGSGHSTRPADKADMGSAVMADDIDLLRQHLALDSIDLMGHSNGGAIAISYAQRYGKTCRKLVLVDSQLIGFPCSDGTGEIIGKVKDNPLYRDAVSHLAKPLPTTDEAFTQHLLGILPLYFRDPQNGVPRLTETMGGLVAQWAFHAQNAVDALPSADQTAYLERIDADTLIAVGRHDWCCPVAVSERLHAGIRRSKLAVFEKTGHMPWIEEPERFFPEVTRFLLNPRA